MASSELIETWTLYAVGSLVIFARIGCRWRMIGFSAFQPDDYIIVFSWVVYTVMTVAAHIVGGLGDLHALDLEVRRTVSEEEAQPYVYGTQWFCAGVATYILFIWTLKLNMLFLYQRVVQGLWVEKFLKPAMFLVGLTFFASYLILFCACRPYNRMWIVYPDQGPICQPQSTLNMVPPLIMNVLTDILIMGIPAPVLLKVKTTIWKRLGLLALFGGGFFVMIAAVLRVSMVLIVSYQHTYMLTVSTASPTTTSIDHLQLKNGPVAAIWSCREDFVAIIIGQAILIRPMFTSAFWTGKYNNSGGYSSTGPSKHSANIERSFEMHGKQSGRSKSRDPFSVTRAMATVVEDGDSPPWGSPNGSTAQIIDPSDAQGGPAHNTAEKNSATYPGDYKDSADFKRERSN
ncbi:hypothetical protein MGN70_006279 [Eutypa lata]|nr:hypothetical protein MGN70_006279 [Eutypa lata]